MISAEHKVFGNVLLCVEILKHINCYRNRATCSVINATTLSAYRSRQCWYSTDKLEIEKGRHEGGYGLYRLKLDHQTHPNTEFVSIRDMFQLSNPHIYAHLRSLILTMNTICPKELAHLFKNLIDFIPDHSLLNLELHLFPDSILRYENVQDGLFTFMGKQARLKKIALCVSSMEQETYLLLLNRMALMTQLEYISINDSGNFWGEMSIDSRKAIMTTAEALPNVKTLYLCQELCRGVPDLIFGFTGLSHLDLVFDYWHPVLVDSLIAAVQKKQLTKFHLQVSSGEIVGAESFYRDICRLVPNMSGITEFRLDILDELNSYAVVFLVYNFIDKLSVPKMDFIARCVFVDVLCCTSLMTHNNNGIMAMNLGGQCIRFSKQGRHIDLHCH
jgi:hypothetical protein